MLNKFSFMREPLFVLLFLATVMRFWHLGYPTGLTFDEFHYVPAAKILVGITEHPGLKAWGAYPLIVKSPDINFSHPPLAKFIIGAGMMMFGDQGWGWRFFPALFGVLSLLLFFYVAMELLKDRNLATFAVFLLTFDYMHILQSRVAMLDILLWLFDLMAVLAF